MNWRIALAVVLVCGMSLASGGPKGTAPRAYPGNYPAHTERDGVGIGAMLVSQDQVRKNFASDVNRCCLVVEVAIYPGKDKPLEVSLDDFVLHVSEPVITTKPSSAKVVAASLQKKAAGDRDITVSPTTTIGYESGGYDPVTGQRRPGGVYQGAGVGVGVGSVGPKPGSTEKDRSAMEAELSEKGLPEGTVSAPVAGYLYFPVSSKKKDATHRLEYQLNGNKVVLQLP
jgi:hypothetical protein